MLKNSVVCILKGGGKYMSDFMEERGRDGIEKKNRYASFHFQDYTDTNIQSSFCAPIRKCAINRSVHIP